MGIGAHGPDQPLGDQREGRHARLVAMRPAYGLGVHLCHRSARELAPQAAEIIEGGIGAALGMRDDHFEAAVSQLVGGRMEDVVQRFEGRLDQDPARPGGPWASVSSSC